MKLGFHEDLLKQHYSEATILFLKTIAHRVYKYNKNALIITCGPSGSGKSYVDLEIMRGIYAYVHGEFPSDEYVVERTFFKLKEFLAILNSPDIQDPKKSRGQMFISEEVGTQASNRTHQNLANRSYSFIVQTFRAKGMIVFFNVPSFNFVDSQIRKQLHYLLETKMIDTRRNLCVCKPLELQYNSRMDKLYVHNLVAKSRENELLEVDLIGIPRIPKSLEILYEQKKSEFINELNTHLQNALNALEAKEIKALTPKDEQPLTEKMQEVYDLNQQGLTQPQIAEKIGVSLGAVHERLKSCEKRGYEVIKYTPKANFQPLHPKVPQPDITFSLGGNEKTKENEDE